MITHEIIAEAKKNFHYDEETGLLIRTNKTSGIKNKIGDVAGYIRPDGYRYVRVLGKQVLAHRLIWSMINNNPIKDDSFIDHINGDRSDNRMSNIREVTKKENARNQKMRSTTYSGKMGVSFHRQNGNWIAKIGQTFLGSFADKKDAIKVREQAEKEFGYHINHGRVA